MLLPGGDLAPAGKPAQPLRLRPAEVLPMRAPYKEQFFGDYIPQVAPLEIGKTVYLLYVRQAIFRMSRNSTHPTEAYFL